MEFVSTGFWKMYESVCSISWRLSLTNPNVSSEGKTQKSQGTILPSYMGIFYKPLYGSLLNNQDSMESF